jgi:hypothetical protein
MALRWIKKISPDHKASCSNGGHGVARRKSRPLIPGHVDRRKDFGALQATELLTASFREAAPLYTVQDILPEMATDTFSLRISEGNVTSSFIKTQQIV